MSATSQKLLDLPRLLGIDELRPIVLFFLSYRGCCTIQSSTFIKTFCTIFITVRVNAWKVVLNWRYNRIPLIRWLDFRLMRRLQRSSTSDAATDFRLSGGRNLPDACTIGSKGELIFTLRNGYALGILSCSRWLNLFSLLFLFFLLLLLLLPPLSLLLFLLWLFFLLLFRCCDWRHLDLIESVLGGRRVGLNRMFLGALANLSAILWMLEAVFLCKFNVVWWLSLFLRCSILLLLVS